MKDSALERAVWAVGGPTKATFVCQVSAVTLWDWRKAGHTRDGRAAVRLARAAQATGLDVTVDQLVGLDAINGDGDDPEPRTKKEGPSVLSRRYQGSRPVPAVLNHPPDPAARAAA